MWEFSNEKKVIDGVEVRRIVSASGETGGFVSEDACISRHVWVGKEAVVKDGVITGGVIEGGVIEYGANIKGGTIKGGVIEGGVIHGGVIEGGAIKGGEVFSGLVKSGAVLGGVVNGGVVNGGTVFGGTLKGGVLGDGSYLQTGTVTDGKIVNGLIDDSGNVVVYMIDGEKFTASITKDGDIFCCIGSRQGTVDSFDDASDYVKAACASAIEKLGRAAKRRRLGY